MGVSRYVTIDNVWFRDTACHLFLCKRWRERALLKTENYTGRSIDRNDYLGHDFSSELAIVSRMGEVFW
jgi:hypothetical protein